MIQPPAFLAPFLRRAANNRFERDLEARLARKKALRADPHAFRSDAAKRGWDTRRSYQLHPDASKGDHHGTRT